MACISDLRVYSVWDMEYPMHADKWLCVVRRRNYVITDYHNNDIYDNMT